MYVSYTPYIWVPSLICALYNIFPIYPQYISPIYVPLYPHPLYSPYTYACTFISCIPVDFRKDRRYISI